MQQLGFHSITLARSDLRCIPYNRLDNLSDTDPACELLRIIIESPYAVDPDCFHPVDSNHP